MMQVIEIEDSNNLLLGLRNLNSGRKSQDGTFWEKHTNILQEGVDTAVDDHHHSNIAHIAPAISLQDFHDQITSRC